MGMLREGAASLSRNKNTVNDLNVFPVPDGDTGDNMLMTLRAGVTGLQDGKPLGENAYAASQGMLLGARGNSGVILSRIFAGLAKGLEGRETVDAAGFAAAMGKAVESAYGAVPVPVEGTIITVLREGAEAADASGDLELYFDTLIPAMEQSLEHTPELLKALKDAGVVDSGGAGLLSIFQGMKDALHGVVSAEAAAESSAPQALSVDLSKFGPDTPLEFGYCTEFLLRLRSDKVDLETFDEKPLIQWLESAGNSVVAFRDGSIFKAHVHTFKPGEILNYVQQYGEFLTIKIENMALQHHQDSNAGNASFKLPPKKYGIVTVASGEGLTAAFREIGADEVIAGGQTMNPSTQDFLDAFGRINAQHILVFPNNPNIRMAAEQAATLYKEGDVDVVPSSTIGEGYYGIASVDRDNADEEEVLAGVREIMASVATGQVSTAIRDTVTADGAPVHCGQFVGYSCKTMLSGSAVRAEAAIALLDKMGAADRDVLLIFSGAEVPSDEAEAFRAAAAAKYPNLEIMLNEGGQPVYDYITVLC